MGLIICILYPGFLVCMVMYLNQKENQQIIMSVLVILTYYIYIGILRALI